MEWKIFLSAIIKGADDERNLKIAWKIKFCSFPTAEGRDTVGRNVVHYKRGQKQQWLVLPY
ncbi:MAG: hypothetical protein ACLUIQ_00235 [Dialister invisus]